MQLSKLVRLKGILSFLFIVVGIGGATYTLADEPPDAMLDSTWEYSDHITSKVTGTVRSMRDGLRAEYPCRESWNSSTDIFIMECRMSNNGIVLNVQLQFDWYPENDFTGLKLHELNYDEPMTFLQFHQILGAVRQEP